MLTPRHLQRAHLLTEGTQHDSPESTLEFEDSACSIPGAYTTTKQVFVPTHLSRLCLKPGQIESLVPVLKSRTSEE